jgi:hypothetical protein
VFKIILGSAAVVIVVAVAVVLILAARKPDVFRIERTASIKAAPEAIFPFINDFHRWGAWSPWEVKDPAMTRTFSGPDSGTGSAYAWEGNKDVGKGRMQITEAVAPSRIALDLDFEKPFEAHNKVEFTLVESAGTTTVTWVMHGPTPFFSKIFHVFMDMDKLVGADFEAGLAKLRAAAGG